MNFWTNYRHPVTLALFLTVLVSGCGPSSKAQIDAPIPPLRPQDAAPCYDPGVGNDAIVSLAETRLALASCRRSQQNVVAQYNEVRDSFGQNEGRQ